MAGPVYAMTRVDPCHILPGCPEVGFNPHRSSNPVPRMSKTAFHLFGSILSSVIVAATALSARDAAAETCWRQPGGAYYRALNYCVTSVLPPVNEWQYGPRNLVSREGGQRLAWCEGAPGQGIGEAIILRIEGGAPFQRILISNGYGKTAKSYRENGRVRDLRVSTNTGLKGTVRLPDRKRAVALNLPEPAAYRWVRLEIRSVYPGSRYKDTCIDFVAADFQRAAASPAEPSRPEAADPVSPREQAPRAEPSEPPETETDPFGDLGMPDPDELELPE